jgi:glucokinase
MSTFPYPCLLADVGGTNARFAVVETAEGPLSPMVIVPTSDHADFAKTVMAACEKLRTPKPRSFLLAVAGPVSDRKVALSNAVTADGPLHIDGAQLANQLHLDQGLLFNDFEALCLALPSLDGDSVEKIGDGVAQPGAPMLVIGAGTGLGVGALLHTDGRFLPVSSEAGHGGLGPETDADFALWPYFEAKRVSAEDLLSGRGLTRLYRAVAKLRGTVSPEDTPAAITARATAGTDAIAVETAERFVGLLGRFAGDMALTFAAKGGVFVGGGIAPRLSHWMQSGLFRAHFEAKAGFAPFVHPIPTALITAPNAALQGLAAVASTPQRFMIDYAERCWRAR